MILGRNGTRCPTKMAFIASRNIHFRCFLANQTLEWASHDNYHFISENQALLSILSHDTSIEIRMGSQKKFWFAGRKSTAKGMRQCYLSFQLGLLRIDKEDCFRVCQGLASSREPVIWQRHKSSPIICHSHVVKPRQFKTTLFFNHPQIFEKEMLVILCR